ncbi:MAG: hypothetical protein LC620_00595, partial [Halobacteriales archaeon]|nr:hypothetical protein [Halobacteriales archaeon]
MRTTLVVLLMLLSSLPSFAAQAPAAAPAGPLVEDPAADVAVDAVFAQEPAPEQATHGIDLRSLTVSEDHASFRFAVQVTDLKKGTDAAGEDGQAMDIMFRHGKREFELFMEHESLSGASEYTYGYLYARDNATNGWSVVQYLDGVEIDDKAETLAAVVPREALADARGAAPFPGRTFEGFSVHSRNLFGFFADLTDDMPDKGEAPGVYAVQLGIRQEGDARLSSDEPFRASNGEATTFLFKAKGKNIGEERDTYHLRVVGAPAGWSVMLPETVLDLASDADGEFPVVATVPFNHAHGTAASFVVEMLSDTDPRTVGRIEMGVRYLAIPQPAGHHDTLYFHSRAYDQLSQAFGTLNSGNEGVVFMDAAEQLDGDAGISIGPQDQSLDTIGGLPYAGYGWCVPLDPILQMGLDFKVAEKGHVAVPVHTTAPLDGAFLKATLYVTPPDSPNYYGYCYLNDAKVLG